VFIPLLILVAQFRAEDAIPFSTVLIGGASVANFLQMSIKKHPSSDKPLIDYYLAMMLQPLALAGTLLGVIFNTIFPNWLLLLCLVVVLAVTMQRTAAKGWRLWHQEKRISEMGLSRARYSSVNMDPEENEVMDSIQFSDSLRNIAKEERKTPIMPFISMLIVLAITTVLSLLKGGTTGQSIVGVKACSVGYWFISITAIPLLIAISIGISYYLHKRHNFKEMNGYIFQQGDIRWTRRNLVVMSVVSLVAGLLAGLLGIGGGMVFGPLMLEFHVLPEVAAATSSFMILFTSIATIIQYAILGRVVTDYAIWFGGVGFLCSLIGQTLLTRLVLKYKKTSIIVLCITAVIAVSLVLLIAIGVMNIVSDVKADVSFGFQNPCEDHN
jgi:uncharacterized membrane protein YfcA